MSSEQDFNALEVARAIKEHLKEASSEDKIDAFNQLIALVTTILYHLQNKNDDLDASKYKDYLRIISKVNSSRLLKLQFRIFAFDKNNIFKRNYILSYYKLDEVHKSIVTYYNTRVETLIDNYFEHRSSHTIAQAIMKMLHVLSGFNSALELSEIFCSGTRHLESSTIDFK